MPKWLVRAVAVVVIASLWWGVGAVGAASVDAATGPDVASWQHPNGAPIDWGQVRAAGHDFAFIKDTPFGRRRSGSELVNVQFRSEFFNLFNRGRFGLPNVNVDDVNFGISSRIADIFQPRRVQVGARIVW